MAGSVPEDQQAAAIAKFGHQPVLLAGETPGFAEQGGTVNFYVSGETVRFEINVATARRQNLNIDAKLLSLAHLIKGT